MDWSEIAVAGILMVGCIVFAIVYFRKVRRVGPLPYDPYTSPFIDMEFGRFAPTPKPEWSHVAELSDDEPDESGAGDGDPGQSPARR